MAENLQQFIDTLKAQLAKARTHVAGLQAKLQQAQETLALTCEAHLETRAERDAAIEDAAEQRALAETWKQAAGNEAKEWAEKRGIRLSDERKIRPAEAQEEGDDA